MGIEAIIAENQRLRREMEALVAQKDALLAEKNAEVVELNQKVALLVEENNQLTRRMEWMLLKASDRRNQRYADDKTLPLPSIHNNRSEFALRGPVVGRKAWLFAGSEGGASGSVLTRLLSHPVTSVHELTPRNWRLSREGWNRS